VSNNAQGSSAIAPQKWGQKLSELYDHQLAAFKEKGYKDPEDAARTAVITLANALGGRLTYLPRGTKLKTAIRDRELYKRWADKGAAPEDLADHYNVCTQHAYDIINKEHAREIKRRQGQLPL
jgi:Mor family transcriptional regulator